MVQLSKTARKLLRQVAGKPHAGSEDHEKDIYADPESSSDEAQPSPPSETRTEKKETRRRAPGKRIRVPRHGSFEKGIKDKATRSGRHGVTEKQNAAVGASGVEKREADESPMFGMEHSDPKRHKTGMGKNTYSAIKNIHVGPTVVGKRTTFGKGAQDRTYQKAKNNPPSPDEDNMTNDMDKIRARLGLNRTSSPTDKTKTSQPPSPSSKPPQSSLLASLGNYVKPSPSSTNDETHTSRASTPRSSHAPSDTLQTLEQDIADLPPEDRDSKCSLCQQHVDSDHSLIFWANKERTVRNQTIFCKEHKLRTAQAQYRAQGFPEIEWEALPRRIKRFKPELESFLRNDGEEESEYRKQHATKLASGKAAVLPTRRKRRKSGRRGSDPFTESASPTMGYYGPRGKRLMMEVITSDLSDVIREVSATDPVVGRSGFAVYLQAVLVPELTILLVMEDFSGVSVARAKEVITESEELGILLNDDVDDEIVHVSDAELDDWEHCSQDGRV